MKIFICGQKSFGKAVLKRLYEDGHEIVGIAPAPQNIKKDKMVGYAELKGIPVISDCDKLVSSFIPDGTDLIVSAHSHWLVSDKCLEKTTYGGIGFHPSLLPLHRGQDAVRWAVAMGDKVTGGTVYKLSGKCDGGDILDQRIIFIDRAWDYHELWKNMFPVGIEMVSDAVKTIEAHKDVWREQDERFATFEPSWDRPRLKRNELMQLCGEVPISEDQCPYDCEYCTMHIADPELYTRGKCGTRKI